MKRFHLLAGMAILLLLASCNGETKKRLNCICLVDYSGSLSRETLDSYASIITESIFRNMSEYDRLIVLPIDEGAKTQPVKIIYEDLATMKFSRSTDGFTHKQDSAVARIHAYVNTRLTALQDEIRKQKELRKQFTRWTDIVSALEQVQQLMEQPGQGTWWENTLGYFSGKTHLDPDNAIVIFSDMIHESKEYNFSKFADTASTQFGETLASLQAQHRIASLQGCSVFIDGRTGRNNAQVDNIKTFWQSYFEQSGANVLSYDYDCSRDIEEFLEKRKTLNQ